MATEWWRICWGSTRTRFNGSFSSWIDRFANDRLASVHAFKPYRRWPAHRTSAGRPICAASGLAVTAGQRWRGIDCHTWELLGWNLSRSGRASTAPSAFEHALIAQFGTLGRVPKLFLLRSDNGLVFTCRDYTALGRSYGLRQEFITPHCPQQNGMVDRVIRTLKEQCAHRHRRSDSVLQHRRTHEALKMKTPAEAFSLAA